MICCHRCGAELSPGTLKFLVTIHVTADFDGVLPDQGEMEDLEAFMRKLDAANPAELEKDVYQSQGYVLCPACKAAFLGDPLGARNKRPGSENQGRVH
jgi:hypothetical protein